MYNLLPSNHHYLQYHLISGIAFSMVSLLNLLGYYPKPCSLVARSLQLIDHLQCSLPPQAMTYQFTLHWAQEKLLPFHLMDGSMDHISVNKY